MAKATGVKHKAKDDIPKAKLSKENFKKSFRLFKYLGGSKWIFGLGMVFVAGTAAVGLYFPIVAGKMFGYLGQTAMAAGVFKDMVSGTGTELLILLVIQGLVSFGRVYTFSIVTENILKGLRTDTFNKLVKMPMSFFSKNQVAELSSRLSTDINVISEAFTVNIAEVIRQTIVGVGGLCLLVYFTSWDVAKWFIIIIPPLTFVAILYGRKIRGYSKALQDKIAARQPFKDFQFGRSNSDGSRQQFRVSGEPLFNRVGDFIGFRGVGVEISQNTKPLEATASGHLITQQPHTDLPAQPQKLLAN